MDPTDPASRDKARHCIQIAIETRRAGLLSSEMPVGYLMKRVKQTFNLADLEYDAVPGSLNL